MLENDAVSFAFGELPLAPPLLGALQQAGYVTPTPIQSLTIPHLLQGGDLVGQAQTGTGKTAAFALPFLQRLDLSLTQPQLLVLTPTRELALQVAEAFRQLAIQLRGFRVLAIYGGQGYDLQLRQLDRGVHVVVGTPGRLLDHLQRGTLNLGALKGVVLDEADEMLRMGFIEDVETILQQTPAGRQLCLFSATIPPAVRRIAQKHLQQPKEVLIKANTSAAETIRQRYWLVRGLNKLDALTRILEAEPIEGMIIFVSTRSATVALAEELVGRGYEAEPLSGDMTQRMRERTVERLKQSRLKIMVATDVAARGLDVEQISHIVNYDAPNDTEAYVHRIGRTGRAGRSGEAILFLTYRERHLLSSIERVTQQKIEPMILPSVQQINAQRIARFKERISATLESEDTSLFQRIIEEYHQEHEEVTPVQLAAALAKLSHGPRPLLLKNDPPELKMRLEKLPEPASATKAKHSPRRARARCEMEQYRMEVGRSDGVTPRHIVGAIANEARLDSDFIGRIEIFENHSTVDLPQGMPPEVLRLLKKVWICQKQMNLSPVNAPRELSRPAKVLSARKPAKAIKGVRSKQGLRTIGKKKKRNKSLAHCA
jgi:ATP-dependent RNA helicase DeaD